MAAWLIRVIGKQRKEVDKDLVVQAIILLGRQLREEEQAKQQAQDSPNAEGGAA